MRAGKCFSVVTAMLVLSSSAASIAGEGQANDQGSPRAAPTYRVDPFWPKPLPAGWITGEVAGTCIDSQDHVFTLNRGPQNNLTDKEKVTGVPSPAVIEFSPDGEVVNSWGAPGSPQLARMPTGLHGCFVDFQDNVWIAGNGDGVVQKYSHDGSALLLQIGTKGVCDSPTTKCGTPDSNSSRTLLNEPANMAVDPANGEVYIADGYGNHRVVVFDKNGVYQRQWGSAGTGPGQFSPGGGGHPHCVVLGNDNLVYACDRANDRIEVFDKKGNLKRIIPVVPGTGARPAGIGSAWDLKFSNDATQTFMFEVDGGNEVLWTFNRAAGLILAGFGRPGHMAGDFTFLHSVAIDSKGNLFTGETIGGRRIQKFKRHGGEDGNDD